MSGGRWDYRDRNMSDLIRPIMIPGILQALEAVFYEIDLAESGDADRECIEPKIYDMIKKLGDDMFG
jgi:hypothetical protein